jgi:hypothetical protein
MIYAKVVTHDSKLEDLSFYIVDLHALVFELSRNSKWIKKDKV